MPEESFIYFKKNLLEDYTKKYKNILESIDNRIFTQFKKIFTYNKKDYFFTIEIPELLNGIDKNIVDNILDIIESSYKNKNYSLEISTYACMQGHSTNLDIKILIIDIILQ